MDGPETVSGGLDLQIGSQVISSFVIKRLFPAKVPLLERVNPKLDGLSGPQLLSGCPTAFSSSPRWLRRVFGRACSRRVELKLMVQALIAVLSVDLDFRFDRSSCLLFLSVTYARQRLMLNTSPVRSILYTPITNRLASAMRTLFLWLRFNLGFAHLITSSSLDIRRTAHSPRMCRSPRLPRLVNLPW